MRISRYRRISDRSKPAGGGGSRLVFGLVAVAEPGDAAGVKRLLSILLRSKYLVPLTLLAAAVIVVVTVVRQARDPFSGRRERVGYQDADLPLAMPAGGKVDERFGFLTAWQRVQTPVALRFDPPLGSDHGGLAYNAQKFQAPNEARGGNHLGDDLNGIGGMNSDLGDPVFAVADGLVVYAGEPSNGWGNVIVVAHRTADGRSLHSMYAHLDRMSVSRGSLVARGGRIGTVGTAHGNYPAHLHFEMRDSDETDLGAGYGPALNRLDPAATVEGARGAAADDRQPSALALLLRPDEDPWSLLETKDANGAARLLELIGEKKAEP